MAKILLVAEAWGTHEARTRAPLVGPSGVELLRMLDEAEIITFTSADRDYLRGFYNLGDPAQIDMIWRLHPEVHRTNVFNLHPQGNDLATLCGEQSEALLGWPKMGEAGWLRAEFLLELARLEEEILTHRPNVVVALGNIPLWALCGLTKISKLRGTTRESTHLARGTKVLPTYHPAAVLREWTNRTVTVFDLQKAKRESEFRDVRRPKREVWIEPDIVDIQRFFDEHVFRATVLSVDIETSGTRVTCIGFAPRTDLALVVPFDDERRKGRNYWENISHERAAWKIIRKVLEDRTVAKLFQNGLYDIAFLWRSMNIRVMGAREDTMLLHHALQPESPKGLGFLGSIYTDEGDWKNERRREAKTLKKDQ